MGFKLFDAGAEFRNGQMDNADCQVRALVTAGNYNYHEAWDILYTLQGKYRSIGFTIKQYLDGGELNVVRRLSFPAKRGRSRMTPAEFSKTFTKGRYILRMAHHVAACVDGTVIDKWDCTRKCVYCAWEIRSATEFNSLSASCNLPRCSNNS